MFVDLLLTNPEQRQLQLLMEIRAQQRIEFTELSRVLGWPYVSTQQVYRRVVANYQQISGQKLAKKDVLDQVDWITHKLAKYLIQHSVGYQCLVAAIRDQPRPVFKLGEQTTINRLRPLEDWLAEHKIHYDVQNNELAGDERVIRIFGWQLFELAEEEVELTDDEVHSYVALVKLLPFKTQQTPSLMDFLKVTAIRLTQMNYLNQKNENMPNSKNNELLQGVNFPDKVNGLRFNLVEVYWLQYMVTYSPYFVDTRKTKLVRSKEKAVIPYLIQMVVKTAVTRLRIYRSPLYFEQLDEYLMESIQLALLLGQPAMHLDQGKVAPAPPKLKKLITNLVYDIPELQGSAELITTVLNQETRRFVPRQRVNVGYPTPFDDYTVGVLQQQFMTQFITIDWHLHSSPLTTEVTTPTFRIVLQPTQPSLNQYYWQPWWSLSKNIQYLLQKIQIWLQNNAIPSDERLPQII